jgi:hypothetical protein
MATGYLRGYSIKQTAIFIDKHFDSETSKRLRNELPEEVKAAIPTLQPAEWYPREYEIALLRAIASVRGNDEGSFADLIGCGEFVASEATNSFLKILMKMLTPTMFAKKVPEFYLRDNKNNGHFEVDVSKASQGRIDMALIGCDGFDHMPITAMGWVTFGLRAMGKKGVQAKQKGWSLATPSPHEVRYEVTWK